MPTRIKTERDRVARGRSYVLKTSVLERVLAEARIAIEVHLNYWTPQSGGSILQAHYWMPNRHVPHRRLHLRAGSVPSEERRAAATLLEEQGLPAFRHWLAMVHGADDDSSLLAREPWFDAEFRDASLKIDAYPAPART